MDINSGHLNTIYNEDLSEDECLKRMIGMLKELSREELIEFYSLTKAYKAFYKAKDSFTS